MPFRHMDPGAERGDRTRLFLPVEQVPSPESELRAGGWRRRAPVVGGGVAVSRTRNGLLIRESRSPYRPTPLRDLCRRCESYAEAKSTPAGSKPVGGALADSSARLRPGGPKETSTHTDSLLRRQPPSVGLRRRGTGPGDRTLRGRFVIPVRSPARSSRVVWVGGFEPPISGSRSRRSARLSHTQVVATEGVEPSWPALWEPPLASSRRGCRGRN
jgi:hypothetical protein